MVNIKQKYVIIIIFNILISSLCFSQGVIGDKINSKNNLLEESCHIIQGVPYVSQETDFFCSYACPTMVLKYYGINTTLSEVLFNSGIGYSLIYSIPSMKRFIISALGSSNGFEDRAFLASLYGLSFEEAWLHNTLKNKNENWQQYWFKLKENISNDIPVITMVDPVFLSSIRNSISADLGISEDFWNKFPNFIWDFVPCLTNHVIVVVGFNETNNSICFNDPVTDLLGYPELGHYSWMNLSLFEEAMYRFSIKTKLAYYIGVFKHSNNIINNKDEIFEKAYLKNIEKMKGNLSSYNKRVTENWNCTKLGVNALIQLNNDLDKGFNNRFKTIILFKFQTEKYLIPIAYKLYFLFEKLIPSVFDMNDFQSQINYFYQNKIEKEYISNYLWDTQFLLNDNNLSKICRNNSILISNEAENSSIIAEYFTIFLKKGMLLTYPRAIIVTNNMQRILEKMIAIEEEILGL